MLGDILSSFLGGAGEFGSLYSADRKALANFYGGIYFSFGLKPVYTLRDMEHVPVQITSDFFDRMSAFEIRGEALRISEFISDSRRGVYGSINHCTTLPARTAWAYDISDLHKGILRGTVVPVRSNQHLQSEEHLNLLNLIGAVLLPTLSGVPTVRLGFGYMWEKYGVPDEISVTLHSFYPLGTEHFRTVLTLILNSYSQRGNLSTVQAAHKMDLQTRTLTIVFDEVMAGVQPQHAPEQPAPAAAPAQNFDEVGDDGFPYGFYRGLGLIDDEDKVVIPSFLGPIRVDMRSEEAHNHLLSHKTDEGKG